MIILKLLLGIIILIVAAVPILYYAAPELLAKLLERFVEKPSSKNPLTGADAMIGKQGIIESISPPHYHVRLRGERWRAISNEILAAGDSIIVDKIEGLTLHVTREQKNANGGIT
jgi:membrane protein implicated in regulation of membrane protease activity